MSKYTTEVRFICEANAGLLDSKGYDSTHAILESAAPKIFSFDFPIFDEDYRLPLEIKILKHYYTREIGEETVGLWKLRLDSKLNEIMPYYNQLYLSTLLEYDPLWTTNITVEHQGNGGSETDTHGGSTQGGTVTDSGSTVTENRNLAGSTTNNLTETRDLAGTTTNNNTETRNTNNSTSTHNDNWNLYSDTPQGGIGGIEGATDSPTLGNNAYLTNATHDYGDTTTNSSENNSTIGNSGNGSSTDKGTVKNTGDVQTTDTGTVSVIGQGSNTRTINTNDSRDNNVKVNTIDQYITKTFGYRGGNASKNLMDFRKTFLNIDMLIINELKDLFLNLW